MVSSFQASQNSKRHCNDSMFSATRNATHERKYSSPWRLRETLSQCPQGKILRRYLGTRGTQDLQASNPIEKRERTVATLWASFISCQNFHDSLDHEGFPETEQTSTQLSQLKRTTLFCLLLVREVDRVAVQEDYGT